LEGFIGQGRRQYLRPVRQSRRLRVAEPVKPFVAPEATAQPGPGRRSLYASFRVDLPEYLDQELTERSARERVTKTYLIMDALRRAGFTVRPDDLVSDRRKTRFRHAPS
jgi:hypothetical protein